MMIKSDKIYVAGHLGLVGSALVRVLKKSGYLQRSLGVSKKLDLISFEKGRIKAAQWGRSDVW